MHYICSEGQLSNIDICYIIYTDNGMGGGGFYTPSTHQIILPDYATEVFIVFTGDFRRRGR